MLVKLPRSKNGLKVAVKYRPPRMNLPDFITEVLDLIDSGDLGDQYIICDDLNCPGPVNTRGLVSEELLKLLDEHSLLQHVREATCRTGNILDHILTPDNMTTVNDVKVIDIGLSDHSLVTCKIVETIHQAPIMTSTFRCWKRLNIDSFKQKLLSSSVYRYPATTVNLFTDQLQKIYL